MPPRAVLFDLDDTLAESKQAITADMAEALKGLLGQAYVGIISGGAFSQFKTQVLDRLPEGTMLEHLCILPTSGASLYLFRDGMWKAEYEHTIEEAQSAHIVEVLEEAIRELGVIDPNEKTWGPRIELRGAQVTLSVLGQQAPIDAKRAWDPTHEKRESMRAFISPKLSEYDVKIGGTTSIDVTLHGMNKAFGVRALAKHLVLPVSDMRYMGDALFPGGNDEVVKQTGIETTSVTGPSDTLEHIRALIRECYAPRMTTSSMKDRLSTVLRGDVTDAPLEIEKYSRDTSIFTRTPEVVVYPKDASDVSALVTAVREATASGMTASVTARAAGTCMSGGPLTTSVVAVFTKHMNKILEVGDGYAITEPGVYYRDFEKATLAKGNQIMPSYPASRELCAMGGIVNNNSGGERTLEYGKTSKYVEELEVILDDGSRTTFKALSPEEVTKKKALETREGAIYRDISALLETNKAKIAVARPKVSKNSAGYALWDVMDETSNTMNLAKLITGAQGTLALTTRMKLRLVKQQGHRAMLVVFLSDLQLLPDIVHKVLPFNPESFESYDDHTFKLAIKFLPQMLSQMGVVNAARLGLSFLPEVAMVLRGGVPKLVLMAEFSEDTKEAAIFAAAQAYAALLPLGLQMSVKKTEKDSEKYWKVRRESFALLRKNVHGLYAAPFIDDFVVSPDVYPEFLPKLDALLAEYKDDFIYTIAGHIGNGNFHIIPLIDLKKERSHTVILELSKRVYDLVLSFGGSTTGEHNDGIIRTPFLTQMFGEDMVALFAETKKIFDPTNVFNPGKKVGGTFEDIERDMLRKL